MDTPIVRAASIALLGLSCVWYALRVLDIPMDREAVAQFVVLPIGALCLAASIWYLVSRVIGDD